VGNPNGRPVGSPVGAALRVVQDALRIVLPLAIIMPHNDRLGRWRKLDGSKNLVDRQHF